MPKTTEFTSFTKDIQGRYLCNDINEVNAWKVAAGGRPFDVIVIGGGARRRNRGAHLVPAEGGRRRPADARPRSRALHGA